MKTTFYRGTVSILLLTMLLAAPALVQAQIDASKLIDLPAGGSIDLPMDLPMEGGGIDLPVDGGSIDLPGDGALDGLSGESEYFDVIGGSTGEETPSNPEDPGPGVPIDGGLSLLLAAGVGYGANRLRKMRKKGEG